MKLTFSIDELYPKHRTIAKIKKNKKSLSIAICSGVKV